MDSMDDTYHRKLDRSPEKHEFFQLPGEDRRLIGQLRSVMSGARSKVTQLRDEVEDRERDASREAALRRAAETRLEQLVDMYGDPAVMAELRERLPRAGEGDVRDRWEAELKDLVSRPQQTRDAGSGVHRPGSEEGEDADTPDGKEQDGSRPRHSDSGLGRSPTTTSTTTRRSHSPEHRHHSPEGASVPTWAAGQPPFWPYGGAIAPQFPGYYPPPMYGMATPQMVYASPVPPLTPQQGGAPPGAPTFLTPIAHSTPSGAFPQQQQGGGNLVSSSSRSTPNLAAGGATGTGEASVSREQNRQIAMLVAELDAARALNKKLQEKLTTAESELEALKIAQKTRQAETACEISGRVAALVEEVYRAQKTRDEAMLGRLRLANEERDEALLKLQKQETRLNEYTTPHGTSPENVDLLELVGQMEKLEPRQMEQQGRQLLDVINTAKQRRRHITTEEMKAVLEERDAALDKCQTMEVQLLKLQRQVRGQPSERHLQATLQAKLLTTQQERDMALARARQLEEELQSLSVYYSLHKSLSQEAGLRDQFNSTLENMERQLKQRDSQVDLTQKERSKLLAQIKVLIQERSQTATELDKAQTTAKESQENCVKLERLVNVLRRRISGLGSKSDQE